MGYMVRTLPYARPHHFRACERLRRKCDVEENDDIAMEFGVRNIPTILFFKGGQLVDKFVGAASRDKIEEKFKALLG